MKTSATELVHATLTHVLARLLMLAVTNTDAIPVGICLLGVLFEAIHTAGLNPGRWLFLDLRYEASSWKSQPRNLHLSAFPVATFLLGLIVYVGFGCLRVSVRW